MLFNNANGAGGGMSWTPTAALQSAANGQWNPQNSIQPIVAQPPQQPDMAFMAQQMAPQGGSPVPDPMVRAQEHYQANQDSPEVENWFNALQEMSPGDQTGMAAFGPPRPVAPAQMRPTMDIPNFPGLDPVSNVADLVAQVQARTAASVGSGGDEQKSGKQSRDRVFDEFSGVWRPSWWTPPPNDHRGM